MSATDAPILRCRAASGDCPEPATWRLIEAPTLVPVTVELPELVCDGHAEGVRALLVIYSGELGGLGVRLVRLGESA